MKDTICEYKVFMLKDLVLLPNHEVKLDVISSVSKKVIEYACKDEFNKLLVVAPITNKEESPKVGDLPKIGVIANIKSNIELPNGNIRLTLRGENRVIVNKYFNKQNSKTLLTAETKILNLPKITDVEINATSRKLKSLIKKYIKLNQEASNSIIGALEKTTDLSKMTDLITVFLPFSKTKKLEYMQEINPIKRGKNLLIDISEEIEILKVEESLEESIKLKLLEKENDYFLREKLIEIQKQLGEVDLKELDVRRYIEILDKLYLPIQTFEKLKSEIEKYRFSVSTSPENTVLRNYLETVLYLPWNESKTEEKNSEKVFEKLESTHYGLHEIKDRIIDYVKVKKVSDKIAAPIICLVGPPGVGKTSIAKSIANALNREFVKISVGGLNDSSELIGNRKTYLGAGPGKIIRGIKKSGINNPLILIDEVDKMVSDYKGNPASVLLEVLDPLQNNMFIDNYIEEPFDLSKVIFILTANDENNIPYALKDRLEIINLESYHIYDKIDIAKKYIIPKILNNYKIKDSKLTISDSVLTTIINHYTKEAGVRELDRVLDKLFRKVIINEEKQITIKVVNKYLQEFKYLTEEHKIENIPGVVNTLAYANSTGVITKLEAFKYKGDGQVEYTGNLGPILNESVKVALSYIKINYKLDIKNYNIHLHLLNGAVFKDGPSAGISITTALISILKDKIVPNNIAFTGEITLSGSIQKIGGLKEKISAAINNDIEKIYVPYANKNDLKNIPDKYLKNIKIVYVKNYSEIYKDLFEK